MYTCKECTNKGNRITWHKHKIKYLENHKKWDMANKEKRRESVNKRYKEMKDTVISAYGGCCKRCGYSDKRALCVDHVNGGGRKERMATSPAGLLLRIIRTKFPPQYQVLCFNCNVIKMYESKEFPGYKSHQGG
jgi:hypothetical protein